MPPDGSAISLPPDTSRPATSTSAQLSMFDLATCGPIVNATSSRESADGAMPSDSQDGQTTGPSGPEAVHVSRFRSLDSDVAMPTNATSGPLFTHSSPSAALQRSLENRLRVAMDVSGSPLFVLTWKQVDMSSGPPICQLRALARRISGNGFGGWPTAKASDGQGGRTTKTEGGGNSHLDLAARLASWPTPVSNDDNKSPEAHLTMKKRMGERDGTGANRTAITSLQVMAQTAAWPTPMAGTPAQKGYNEAGNTDSGRKTVALATWPTPMKVDGEGGRRQQDGKRGMTLREATIGWGRGPISSGSHAAMRKHGQLNPAFSRWLQAYPKEWDVAAIEAHRLIQTIRRKRE